MPKRKAASYSRARKRARKTAMYRRKRGRRLKSRRAKFVKSVVYRMAETKEALKEVAKNVTLWHNTVKNLDNNAFYTDVGTRSEQMSTNDGCRIGKKIYATRMKVAVMIESQQYRPQVSYWLYLIKRKGNSDTGVNSKDDMFEGRSTTIPMDWIDTGKVDVLYCKKIVPRMPNSGTTLAMAQDQSGVNLNGVAYEYSAGESYHAFTNPQHISKFSIPLRRTIMYKDESTIPSSQRYQWVVIAYDNFTTYTGEPTAGGFPCGHISLTTVLQFKDV